MAREAAHTPGGADSRTLTSFPAVNVSVYNTSHSQRVTVFPYDHWKQCCQVDLTILIPQSRELSAEKHTSQGSCSASDRGRICVGVRSV